MAGDPICPDCHQPIPEDERERWPGFLPSDDKVLHARCADRRRDAAIWARDARP